MKPSLDKLIKFIKLEAERGYDNRAVVGGLDKIYPSWEAEARAESLPDELIQAVAARLRDYSQLTPASRSDMLQGLWKRIQRSAGANLPQLPQLPDPEDASDRQPSANNGQARQGGGQKGGGQKPTQQKNNARPGQPPSGQRTRSTGQSAGQQSGQEGRQQGTHEAQTENSERPTRQPRPDQRRGGDAKQPERGQQVQNNRQRQNTSQSGGERGPQRPDRQKPPKSLDPSASGQQLGQRNNPAFKPEYLAAPSGEDLISVPNADSQNIGAFEMQKTAQSMDEMPVSAVSVSVFDVAPEVLAEIERSVENRLAQRQPVEVSPTHEAASPLPEDSRSAWATAPRRTRIIAEGAPAALNAPVTVLQGVGPRHAETIAKLGLHNLGDMLYYFPRRYLDYSQLRPINRLVYGEVVTVLGAVESANLRPARSGKMQIVEAVISDGSGKLRVTWFNQPWLARKLQPGMYVSLSGKIEQYLGRLAMSNPEMEQLDQDHLHTNRIVPVYPLTANITQHWLRGLMHQVVIYWAGRVSDPLSDDLRRSAELLDLPNAIMQAHFPDSMPMLQSARHRLAFDEIFLLQIGVMRQKKLWLDNTARIFETPDGWLDAQLARLPYLLTGAQKRSVLDIQADLRSGRPMNRLLQGDVGAGKTIVAALSMALLASQGVQSALMAPTSILAEQHYKNLIRVLCPADGQDDPAAPLQPEQIRLMVGATSEADKAEIRAGLASGEIKVIIGTHALIEDPVTFARLELVIIDEQHRFGVQQRAALRSKGASPHLLVMTATPIPRSLSLTVYGDLDLSILDEMPPGRQPVETQVYYPRERERAYTLIRSQIEQGRQAFIIYPLVEENEKSEGSAAVEEHARLQKTVFSHYRLGLLHGRLKPDEKDAVMADFRDGKTQILVSTSVVEVGVDVPNATVMMIEGANRFGLSQLHQFRGRVGRGSAASYCILIPDSPDDVENQRLSAMVETNDGFVLAERDLEQRGPGEFLGTRQSGYHSELRLASLTDVHLIEKARRHAQEIFANDPDLSLPEHQVLAEAVDRFWQEGQGDIS